MGRAEQGEAGHGGARGEAGAGSTCTASGKQGRGSGSGRRGARLCIGSHPLLSAPLAPCRACAPRSKLDALATEYNHLLVTQLESQRSYFEGLLVRQRAEAEAEVEAAQAAAGEARGAAADSQAAAQEAERRRRQAESKLVRHACPALRLICPWIFLGPGV